MPQDFARVLFPAPELEIPGAMIGSAPRLLAECRRLAELIGIPEGLDPEDEAVWDAADDPEAGEARWERYGIETFGCIRLLRACEVSLRTGAAIVFH